MAEGIRYRLWRTFGWYRSNPVNLSKEEVERLPRINLNQLQSIGDSNERWASATDPQAHIADMVEMSQHDMVQSVLSIYAEESTQPDISEGKAIWYECNDPEVEEDLNSMLERINTEDYIYSIAYQVAGCGNSFRRILRNADGIQQVVAVAPDSVKRIWDPTTRRLLGFQWTGGTPRDEDVIFDDDETVFAPWEFIHFRRIADTDTEYGKALLDHLHDLYRKIRRATDQMVMYRLHAMPNRHAIFVDTGNQTIMESMETINNFKTLVRNNLSINPNTGEFHVRYDMPSMESILWLPVRAEETTRVEEMKGDRDVPDVHDIEYLTKAFFGGARVPKAYVGHGDDSGGLAQGSLVSQDIRFARMVRVLRRPIVAGFHRLAQLHMLFRGLDPDTYKITVRMSKISSIEEEVNAAAMEVQVNLSRSIVDICQSLDIPNKEIIELVFKEYLHLPRKFIDVAKLAAALAAALGGTDGEGGVPGTGGGPPMGGGGLGDAPDMSDLEGDLGLGGGGPGDEDEDEIDIPPDLASRGRRPATLVEAMTRGPLDGRVESAATALISSVRGKARALVEAKNKEGDAVRVRLREAIQPIISEAARVHGTGRTSLVEAYEAKCSRNSVGDDASYPKAGLSADGAWEGKAAVVEAAKLDESTGGRDSARSHPAVTAARRARKK